MPPSPESNTPSDDSNEEKGSVSPIIGSTNINSVEKIGKKNISYKSFIFSHNSNDRYFVGFFTIFFIFFQLPLNVAKPEEPNK